MPNPITTITATGRINRRDIVTNVESEDVLIRENFAVVGSGKAKKNKKCAGSSRLGSSEAGTSFVSGIRYYNATVRKTFAFNSNGYLYYIDDNGNKTQLTGMGVFDFNAVPTFVNFRVSDIDVLYFMEGVSTGMYSYDGNIGNSFNKEVAVTLNFVDAVEHLDRLWAFEDNSESIHYSANLDPTNFTSATDAGEIVIAPKRGSKIMRIVKHNETIYIIKQDGIYVLEGSTPATFAIREVHPFLGTCARHSVVNVQNGFAFLGSDFEVYVSGGTQDSTKLLTYNVALGGDFTKDLPAILNKVKVGNAKAIFHNYIYRLSFTESGETINKMEYCFNTINETDFFTRGNNVSCYVVQDRYPDTNELYTGRSDSGYWMKQYQGLNWDNDSASASMAVKLQTAFIGSDEPRNFRVRRIWGDFGVLGNMVLPVKMWIDARNANSDTTTENMDTYGEEKTVATIAIASQQAITSRQIPKHGNAKCRNFSLFIDSDVASRDVEISKFYAEIIGKNLKRSRFVAQ